MAVSTDQDNMSQSPHFDPGKARVLAHSLPRPSVVLRLIKPVTWFPPVWAYLCGTVSAGAVPAENWMLVGLGMFLAGPLVCGMSQAANDWCDRHVDAINEPDRPIPSGQIAGRWGLWIALSMTLASLVVGWQLGPWGCAATIVAVLAAWAYSAEPVRLKRSGIMGPGLVGLSYETLPWFTGAAIVAAGAPSWPIIVIALLYGVGAHGIMTLNDFKALAGDRVTGVNSLPVMVGPARAARIACWTMTLPQLAVIALLISWGLSLFAGAISALLIGQLLAMRVMVRDPEKKAPWYNGTGVLLYIVGMMVTAFALRLTGAMM